MNALAQISITRSGDGWLCTCSCGVESWQTRRPQADRWTYDHRRACRPKGAKT